MRCYHHLMEHLSFHQQVLLFVDSPSSHGQSGHGCSRFEVEELSRLAVEEVELAEGLAEVEGCTAVRQEECQ